MPTLFDFATYSNFKTAPTNISTWQNWSFFALTSKYFHLKLSLYMSHVLRTSYVPFPSLSSSPSFTWAQAQRYNHKQYKWYKILNTSSRHLYLFTLHPIHFDWGNVPFFLTSHPFVYFALPFCSVLSNCCLVYILYNIFKTYTSSYARICAGF